MQSRRRRRRWVSDSGAINPHRAAFVLYRYYITLSRDSYAQIMGQERCDATGDPKQVGTSFGIVYTKQNTCYWGNATVIPSG